ncbi:MAG: DUF420 domain-containing protein [Myxococcota bacterium]|nr:DUF420 domain-containing protein [Myxococcota bacterium]
MDLKVIYWTIAWLNLLILSLFALSGVQQVRKGQVARHRRSMLTAAWLVVAFVVSYGFKLLFLGREDLSTWSGMDVWILRIHELFIAIMLVAGIMALLRGRRLAKTSLLSDAAGAPAPDPDEVIQHKRAGRVAVIATLMALLTAGLVLIGMYARLG